MHCSSFQTLAVNKWHRSLSHKLLTLLLPIQVRIHSSSSQTPATKPHPRTQTLIFLSAFAPRAPGDGSSLDVVVGGPVVVHVHHRHQRRLRLHLRHLRGRHRVPASATAREGQGQPPSGGYVLSPSSEIHGKDCERWRRRRGGRILRGNEDEAQVFKRRRRKGQESWEEVGGEDQVRGFREKKQDKPYGFEDKRKCNTILRRLRQRATKAALGAVPEDAVDGPSACTGVHNFVVQ